MELKGIQNKDKKVPLKLFFLLIILASLFIFGCIELKPREGISETIPVKITQGSDVCAGYGESTCGAFLKEKRTAVSNFVCKGPIGPASQKLSNYTYSFDSSRGWNCEKLDSSKSFSFYLSRVSSAPYSISTHCNGYKNWIGKCKQSGPCPVGRKGPLIFTIDRNLKASVDFLEGIDYILANCVGTISGGINGKLDHIIVLTCGAGSVLDSFSLPSLTTTGRCGGVRTPQSDSFKCKYTPYTGNQPYTLSVQTILTERLNECGSGDCGGWDIGITYQFSCDIFANYNVNYVCKNSYTGEEYLYVNCSYDKFSTFQGGKTYLDNNTPYSKLSSYLQSYYGTYSYNPVTGETQPAGTIQVPFFMLGQGPSFQDYEEAKKLCVPWKETIVNVSLGNTTFDPPFLTIPSGMELCIENKDKNKHELDVTDLADQEIVRSIVLQPKQAHCYIPSSGFYHVKDSNGDYAYLSVIKSSNTANIYVGQNIVPNYSVVTDGGIVNITLIERKEHNLTIKSINRFDDFKYEENITLNLSNSVKTFKAPKPGEYQIDDNSTGKKGYLFVQSPLFRFLFRSDGSVDPNYEIYRPIGDLICFRSEVPNLNISVYRYTETEQGYEWIWLTNESISTSSYCCIQGTLPGKYYGITSDGRIANWTIGTGKPSATLSIQQIGFEPEELESTPGTKICWINPSAISRQIITKSSTTGKAFFSGKIPPLSDNVCWPTMNKTDSFVTRFVPDIGPKNIINIKEIETKNIQILPGGGGFDTISAVVKPGSQVCWINNDNKNHTLKDEKGKYLLLEPSQTNCIVKENMKEGDLYTRQLDDKAIYSDVAVIDGTGAILSSRGPVPISLFVQLPETNMGSDGSLFITKPSYFKIINKQPVPSELYEVASVTLSGNSTSLTQLIRNETDTLILQSPINTYTKVMLYVENRDTINHTIRVEATGDEVSVPASSTYIFELSRNTILTDKTIQSNLTRSGVTNETIKNALSQIPISIAGPSEIKLNKSGSNGDILNLAAPKDAMTAVLYENNTGKTLVITFTDTKERILENPLNNLTLDLPVQVVHGDLSSQTLYSMRKYADEGAMSMLIPSFRNATVKIHSSVFSPEEAFIPAGSTITFTNKDVVDHDIELTRNESGSVSSRSFILMPLQSNSTSDTPKNTTFTFVDRLSNMKGNVTTVAYDANIGVVSTPIYPESGMVAVGGPVKFNNYDSDSSYIIEISLRDESNVVHDYRLNLPKYSNGIPGMATWIPDRVGNATYVVKNATPTIGSGEIGSGEIVVKNSIINVSIKDGYFEKKSIAVDHNSKVCFVPNSPRNISITNIDTGEKIAERTIYPVGGQYTDTSGLCKKIYNCTAKQPGSYACSGIVNESDLSTYCSYTILNSSSACKVSSNISCMVKNEYSSDLECTTDYSKDVQPNIPGIQPQCLFQAKIDGDACKGGSVVRNNSLDSIINCSISSDGKLQFNYFSGKEKTNVSNVLCTVSKSGSSTVCNPTGIYPDIGCVNGSAGDPNCYYTPSPLSISELGNPFTVVENRFCNIGRSTRQEIYYTPYLCNISWDFSKDSSCVCPATRYCGDLPCNGKTAFGAIYVYRTLPSSCGVGSDKNTYTCVNNVLSRTCYTSRSQYSVNTPLGSFSTKLTYGLSFKLCECYSKKIVNSEYVSSCQIKTGGSALLPFPSSCILTAERCKFNSPSVFICSNSSNCPCQTGCGKKVNYSALNNIKCFEIGGKCLVSSFYSQDDGRYCNYSTTVTCIPEIGFEDKVSCSYSNSSCIISNSKKIKDDGSRCSLQLFKCEPAYEGVECNYDAATQSCQTKTREQFCFTPSSTYLIQDIESGDVMTVEGYDRYTPLEIDIQKSEFTPSYVKTSPLSDVCFRSLDGKTHTISVPEQVKQDGYIRVNSTDSICLRFPYNPEPWTVRLQDKQEVAAGVKSIKQDIEIVVKSQMFEPSDLILRPNTTLTFVNTDSEQHVLKKASPSLILSRLILQGNTVTSDPLFINILKANWTDKVECRNDSDCPEGSFCDIEKRCHPVKQCLRDEDCPAGSLCNNYRCVLYNRCVKDADCRTNESCIANQCVGITSFCQTNSECEAIQPNSMCVSNKCISITNCSTDSDCGAGFICSNNICAVVSSCTNNSGCPINTVCNNGRCIAPPVQQCNPNEANPCPQGLSCAKVDEDEEGNPVNACVSASCNTNADCSESQNLGCMQNFIFEGLNCTLYNISKSTCGIDDIVCDTGSCVNGKCILPKQCSSNSECGIINGRQTYCGDSMCKLAINCTSSTQCLPGQTCEGGLCTLKRKSSCVNDTDCSSGQVCQAGSCVARQNCSSTSQCNSLQSGAACTNQSSSLPAFCQSSVNCTSDAFCASNAYCDLSLKQCISYPRTTCGSPLYGTDIGQVNVSFKLPASTYKAYLIYTFNDNGIIDLNGQNLLSATRFRCQYSSEKGITYNDSYFPIQQWKIPLGLLKKGDELNNMTLTACSCSGQKGFNISIIYYYVTQEGVKAESITIDPKSQKTVQVPVLAEDFVYLDSTTQNVLPISVKSIRNNAGQVDCSADLSSMALAVASYERLDYATQACDSGKQKECASYNPYGPATVMFFASEAGLNLSDPDERLCAFQQLASVKQICPNCTTVLNVGDSNITKLNEILRSANSTQVSGKAAITYIDVIGYNELLNNYPTCSFEEIMNSIANKSKLALYNYTKPSIIMRFGLKDGESVSNSACNWTGEMVTTAYQDFYGLWIPILAGSGVLGTAQYCLTDPCPSVDFYGLLTSGKTNKPWTDAWFREGCGRYYYAAEGLSFTTFSMKETNYSMCDPSRMLALLQSAQCAIGKYTLKS